MIAYLILMCVIYIIIQRCEDTVTVNALADGLTDTQINDLFNLHQKLFQMVYNTAKNTMTPWKTMSQVYFVLDFEEGRWIKDPVECKSDKMIIIDED